MAGQPVPDLYDGLPSDCQICHQIMRGLITPFEDRYAIDLGPADQILSKECSAHSPLLHELKKRFDKDDVKSPFTISLAESSFRLCKSPRHTNLDITMARDKNGGGLVLYLELANPDSNPRHPGRGLIPSPQWIDPSLFKLWKDTCQHIHGDDCENPLKMYHFERMTPAWLIDVRQKCLVAGRPEMPYATLSYKWGQTKGLQANQDTLLRLQNPNALSDLRSQIPETIQNAIDVVELLGESYLWVDSLCISQDDEKIKLRELNQMAAIYANACVTIIAGEGNDANFGLRGLQGISTPRELREWALDFGTTAKVIKPQFPWCHIPQTPYFKRGWTFQEYLFARRRIIFENQMVRWECSRCAWPEDVILSNGEDARFRCNWMSVIVDGYPSLNSYGRLVYAYNNRELTYPEDCVPAILGLTSLLSQKFEGGFLCGLPEMYFDAALTWIGWHNLEKRLSSGQSSAGKSLTCLPSWSWVDWAGRIDPGCYRKDDDFLKHGAYTRPVKTIPITHWFTSADATGQGKRRISSKFLHERDSYKDLSRPLPSGWIRHEWDAKDSPAEPGYRQQTNDYEYPPPKGMGSCYFTHESVRKTEFWYPIPIPSAQEPLIIPPQTQNLFCDTYRTWLHARVHKDDNEALYRRCLWLRESDDTWAGMLHLHHEDDLAFVQSGPAEGPRIELVAISRGEVPCEIRQHAPLEHHHDESPITSGLYEFYNVLWIAWKDDIAYRRAYGRVLKDAWEKQNPEPVSLVLG